MTRNVADLGADERQVFERVLGHQLLSTQRLFVQISVLDPSTAPSLVAEPTVAQPTPSAATLLPEAYQIFRELSESEIAELETEILCRSESRPG